LIELQGGNIKVESELYKGSKFSFTLFFEKVQNKVPQEQPTENLFTLNSDFLIGKKIIMAEDILINQLLVSKIFQKWNCQLDIVNDGKEVVHQLSNEEYDLVLMDLQMPIMDGYEATKLIREEKESQIPIIALSAHASRAEKEKCLNYGMNALVSKPIDEEVLLFEMYKWLVGIKENEIIQLTEVELNEDPTSNSIINFAYLDSVTKGDKDFVNDLIELVSIEMPKLLERISDFYDENNAESFKKEVHKLKSSITIFGVARGKELIYEMENEISETHTLDNIEDKMNELLEISFKLLKELANI
jgi:CheY-like chemotaxis protein